MPITSLPTIWEAFCDASYYDMWAVRRTTETGWGECFHLNSKAEAEGLTKLLNDHSVP
jgi:hypothetical protein